MMNSEDFKKLEELYLAEKSKRAALNKLIAEKNDLTEALETLKNTDDNSFETLYDTMVSFTVGYLDCEGRREVDRSNIQIELDAEEIISILENKIKKVEAKIKLEEKNAK